MNEERLEAYLNLINALLSCPSGEEEQILKAHSNLVDAEFVEAIVQVVEELEERGDRNTANFLINIAHQLAEVLELPSSTPISSGLPNSAPLDFLLQALQATADNSNPQFVNTLLQDNLDKLDDNFAQQLRSWATARLPEVELEDRQGIAQVISNFSSLISQFQLGNRAINVEIAITGYEVVGTVFTRETSLQDWAMNQGNMGNAYYYRSRGKRAENLEVAIRCYEAALQVYTHSAFPQKWAMIQNNLGEAYRNRIRGERAENVEVAIKCGLAALEVRTPEACPQDWAATQHNLGIAYWARLWGEKAENLETAIHCYEKALKVRTREAFPYYWAETKNNLGLAYVDRIRKETEENLEAAIRCYEEALEVRTPETSPYYWAETKNNLGIAYYRLKEEEEENLEEAIRCYEAALDIYTRQTLPEQWAMTRYNLGEAYRNRIRGEKEKNLEVAIRCFLDVLEEEIYTHEAFPQEWAMVQNGLGIAYLNRIQGKPTENLEAAIHCLLAASYVLTREAFPEDHIVTQFNLGVAYQDAQQFHNAKTAFATAIDAVESLRGEIVSGSGRQADKQKLAEQWNDLYQRMVEVCIYLSNYAQAIEYVERSKARNLVELILSRDLRSIFSPEPEIVNQLEELRDKIASSQYQLQTAIAHNPTALAQHLQQLRQQRNQLQDRALLDRKISIGSGFKFEQFQPTLDDHTALVEFYVTPSGFQIFVVTRYSPQPLVLSTGVDDRNALEDWAKTYLEDYYEQKDEWQKQLTPRLEQLAKILHLNEMLAQIPKECDQLILIPYLALHLLPIHALPVTQKLRLLDCFPRGVRYAPSCQLLQLAKTRQRPNFTHLFAVQNPTSDLTYADLEVATIQSYFDSANVNVLEKAAATKVALDDIPLNTFHCAHFSCHGYFNPNPGQANKSALLLAKAQLNPAPTKLDPEHHLLSTDGRVFDLNKCLTLDAIFTLNLDRCRLVILSACETGLIDFSNISDEYIGLSSGFLYAGSPSVVSSLWEVDQVSTAFLFIKFYENLRNDPELKEGDVAVALQDAQQWLQNLTCEGFEQELAKPQYQQAIAQLQQKLSPADLFELEDAIEVQRQRLQNLDPNDQPFFNPYYWAAFIATGV
jgi:CHAT domain-containing protein